MLCVLNPEFIVKDDHCRYQIRFPKMPHLLLLSVCGFTEIDNFSPMIEQVKKACKNMHLTYVDEILQTAAWLHSIPNLQPLFLPTIDAIKQAGIEIINRGKISEKIKKIINTPILTRGQVFKIHNRNV